MNALVQPAVRHHVATLSGDERVRYATREARDRAIVQMAIAGVPPHGIERKIVVARHTIYMVLARARRDGAAVPFFSTAGEPRGKSLSGLSRVMVRADIVARLGDAAQRRGVDVERLARRLIETVVEEDLVDAVLDDGGVP